MSGSVSYHSGQAAEMIAAACYLAEGYELAARRWRGPGGEIDLILRRPGETVFVEVKSSRSHTRAAARIGSRQLARICASAEAWPGHRPTDDMRIDVALVDGVGRTRRLENVSMEACLAL